MKHQDRRFSLNHCGFLPRILSRLASFLSNLLDYFCNRSMDVDKSVSSNLSRSSLLCLKCRKTGHTANDCPSTNWFWEFGWFFSPARRVMHFERPSSLEQSNFCKRCQGLDVLQMLHEDIPWQTSNDIDQGVLNGSKHIRSLGKTGSIEFWDYCLLCRCLFALTPNPSSSTQDVLIFPHWTMNRLVGENGIRIDTDEKRGYAKCLLIALNPSSLNIGFSIRAHRGDTLCILEEDNSDHRTMLGGREVDRNCLDVGVISEWVSTCSRLHRVDCSSVQTEDLRDIRLVNVSTRQVVRYPEGSCDYLALSYVWGRCDSAKLPIRI